MNKVQERVFLTGYAIEQKEDKPFTGQLRLDLTFVSKDKTPQKFNTFIEEFTEFLRVRNIFPTIKKNLDFLMHSSIEEKKELLEFLQSSGRESFQPFICGLKELINYDKGKKE